MNKTLTGIIIFAIILASASLVAGQGCHCCGGAYQQCYPSEECTIGEFVFDNSYTPLTDQICTLTVWYPDNTIWLDNVSMTNHSNGWHDYTINRTSPLGVYRVLMWANNSGTVACVDKSFCLNFPDTRPSLIDPCPCNGIGNVDLNGTVSIECINIDANMTNLTWYWGNSSSNCIHLFAEDFDVDNGTYSHPFLNSTSYLTTYWWRVNLTSGPAWTTERLMRFTTHPKYGNGNGTTIISTITHKTSFVPYIAIAGFPFVLLMRRRRKGKYVR